MTQDEQQDQRWALIQQRREDDLRTGLVEQVEQPGFAAQVLGLQGWRRIYQEDKNYITRTSSTRVEVYSSDDDSVVAKIDDPGMLIDQASSLIRLHRQFGVTVPKILRLVRDGNHTLLVMEKLRWINGWHIRREAKQWYRRLADPLLLRDSMYMDLYRQGKTLAQSLKPPLRAIAFDVVGLHHGNWGVSVETFAGWKRGQKLTYEQLVVLDPVSMQYRKPGATEIRNEKEASHEFLRQLSQS